MRVVSRVGGMLIVIFVFAVKAGWADKIKTDFDKSASFSQFKTV